MGNARKSVSSGGQSKPSPRKLPVARRTTPSPDRAAAADRLEKQGYVGPITDEEAQIIGPDHEIRIATDELVAAGERNGQRVPSLLYPVEVGLEAEDLAEDRQAVVDAARP
jgi:hypothetical protein